MAGRPAAARGGNGTLYGLIAFAIVSVLALGAFIWQLTQNKQLVDEAARANAKIKEYGSPPSYYADDAKAGNLPVFERMKKEINDYSKLTVGKEDAVQVVARGEVERTLTEIGKSGALVEPGDTLLTAVRKLFRAYQQQKELNAQITGERDQLRSENQTLAEGNKAARTEFEQQVAALKSDVERLEQEKNDALAQKDQQLTQIQGSLDAATEEGNKARVERQNADRSNEVTVARMNRQINELQAKVEALRPSGFNAEDILTKADGHIIRSVPGSDVVYIDLGRTAGVRPGLGFEVYSPRGERRSDYRGKASVEVTSVSDNTAECKVTRATATQPIVEGDILVNIAFERGRKPKFVVRGDFDLNYDGERDFDGTERITALIRQWGGQVVPELDESVDFVVLGVGPQRSGDLNGRPSTDVVQGLSDARNREFEQWNAVLAAAKERYIPVLTQNQFLFLLGYSGRGPVSAQ